MASENFTTPGRCCVRDCEVALVVKNENGERTRLFSCRQKLASLSKYFQTLLYGNFKEKEKKEVIIEDVTTDDLVAFLQWAHQHPRPLHIKDIESLCSLIVLADTLAGPTLEWQILAVLAQEYVFDMQDDDPQKKPLAVGEDGRHDFETLLWMNPRLLEQCSVTDGGQHRTPRPVYVRDNPFGVEAKLKVVEFAESHKGTDANVLEACIRRCADLSIDQVAPLHGKVSDGTLAAVFATVGRAKEGAMGFPVMDFADIKKIKIEKNLFRS